MTHSYDMIYFFRCFVCFGLISPNPTIDGHGVYRALPRNPHATLISPICAHDVLQKYFDCVCVCLEGFNQSPIPLIIQHSPTKPNP